MIEKFIANLNNKNIDLDESRDTWDKRASEFNNFSVDKGDLSLSIITSNMNVKGKRIFDVGFGAGRYLVAFAEKGAHVSGVEISPKMVGYARSKLKDRGLDNNVEQLHISSWEELDTDALYENNDFDLVFLSMSPAISSLEALDKALDLTSQYFFMSHHVHREDSLLEELKEELDMRGKWWKGDSIYNIYNILSLKGYYPSIRHVSETREHSYSVNSILTRYTHWLFGSSFTETEKDLVLKLLNKRSENGYVKSMHKSIKGYLFLDKSL